MSPFFPKSKKLARLKASRKKLPKASRAFFVTLMVAVAMHFQAQLLEHAPHQNAAFHGQVEAGY